MPADEVPCNISENVGADVFGRQAVLRRLLLTNDGIADERSNTSLKMQDAD